MVCNLKMDSNNLRSSGGKVPIRRELVGAAGHVSTASSRRLESNSVVVTIRPTPPKPAGHVSTGSVAPLELSASDVSPTRTSWMLGKGERPGDMEPAYNYVGHIRKCPAVERNLGVKIWSPEAASLYSRKKVYASGDMCVEDWEGCECALYVQGRFNINEGTLSPSGAKKYDVCDLVWCCRDLKPLRTWTRGLGGRKRKRFRTDGKGKYRDISTSPVQELSCVCDLSQYGGHLNTCTQQSKLRRLEEAFQKEAVIRAAKQNIINKNTDEENISQSKASVFAKLREQLEAVPQGVRSEMENINKIHKQRKSSTAPESSQSGCEARPSLVRQSERRVSTVRNKKTKKSGATRRRLAQIKEKVLGKQADNQQGVDHHGATSADGRGLVNQHHLVTHIGNHSVEATGVKEFDLDFGVNSAAQNVISQIGTQLTGWGQNLVILPDSAAVQIRTKFSIPTLQLGTRAGWVDHEDARTIAADMQITPYQVNYTGDREVLYRMQDSDAADLIHGTTVDARKLAGNMNNGPYFPPSAVERIAPILLQRREKINNASLYGLGWLLVHQLQALEALEIQGNYRLPVNNAMVVRHTQVQQNQIGDLVNNFSSDIGTGRIFLDGKYFTLEELSMLRVIASGLPLVTSPDGARRSILQFTASAIIPFGVYFNNVQQIPDVVPGNWNSQRIAVLMRKLATHLEDDEAWVQGYMRAAAIISGGASVWVNEAVPPVATRRWIDSLLQIGGTAWPMPGGTNPMWQWAGITPQFATDPAVKAEAQALSGMTVLEAVRTSHVIGHLIAAGITSVLIKLNLTTVEFNLRYFGQLGGDASTILGALVECRTEEEASVKQCPLLVRAGINWISEFSGINVNWGHFSSATWNNHDTPGDPVDVADRMWRCLAPGVPKIANPMVVAFLLDALPVEWGLCGAPVTVDLSNDIVQDEHGRYWSAELGDDRYEAAASSEAPYGFVSYGSMALGALRQQHNIVANWPVEMRRLHTHTRRGRIVQGVRGDPRVVVRWLPVLLVAEPGTLLTYDWEHRVVLAPEMTEEVLGANCFGYAVTTPKMVYQNAGLVVNRAASTKKIMLGMSGLRLLSKKKGDAGAGESSKQGSVSAEAEN